MTEQLPENTKKSAQSKKQRAIFLTDETWNALQTGMRKHGYEGRAAHLGISAYLRALLQANPSPHNWKDERSITLSMHDGTRLSTGRWPLWLTKEDLTKQFTSVRQRPQKYDDGSFDESPISRGNAGRRNLNTEHFAVMRPILLAIADGKGIRHPNRPNFEGSTEVDWGSRISTCAAVLEAIGFGMLSPKNPCPHCVKPARDVLVTKRSKTDDTVTTYSARLSRNARIRRYHNKYDITF